MYLNAQIHINSKSQNHALVDFLSFNSTRLKNQILYNIRQPLTYYQNIKNNKEVFPQQLEVINKLNLAITQYNQMVVDTKSKKPQIRQIDENNHWVNNQDLLQFYMKDLEEYTSLYSQTSQQVIKQVIDEFKSFHALMKKYKNKTYHQLPTIPFYLDKINDRNMVCFSNQQIKIEGKYLVINWRSSDLLKKYKNKDFIQTIETKLNSYELKKILSKQFIDDKRDLISDFNKNRFQSLNKEDIKAIQQKNHQNLEQQLKLNFEKGMKILNNTSILILQNNHHLKSCIKKIGEDFFYIKQYSKLPNKFKVKIPSDLLEIMKNKTFDNKNLIQLIKQVRLIPTIKNNPESYKLEIIYENSDYVLDNIKTRLNNQTNNSNINKNKCCENFQKTDMENHREKILNISTLNRTLLNSIEKEDLKTNYMLDSSKIDTRLKILKAVNSGNFNIFSIDPGMKRIITMTNNMGQKPLIVKNKELLAFNQWYNKKLAKHQEDIKTHYDQSTSKKIKRLNQLRNRKIKNWFHQLSSQLISYLNQNQCDLLVIGKNKEQKKEIDIGRVNNQKFVQIPLNMLWDMLAYKAYQVGIMVVEQEESYTSKASFIHDDTIPVYQKVDKVKKDKRLDKKKEDDDIKVKEGEVQSEEKDIIHQFSGTRKSGLYHLKQKRKINQTGSKSGHVLNKIKYIHADINGSYNILRKFLNHIGVNFNMDKLLENEKRKNKSNKKILHDLFQPDLWNLGQTINSKNIKKPYKTVELNSTEMEKGRWATANLLNSNKQIIIN